MAIVRWILVAAMAVLAALSVAYSFGLISGDSASAASEQYYCPMHPQVVQDHPGECPICSMSLVKKEATSRAAPKPATPVARKAAAEKSGAEAGHEGHRHSPSDSFYCPMHPEETGTDGSARCPLCGMKLERRQPEQSPQGATTLGGTAVPGLVPIQLSFDRVQLIGVRTAAAAEEELGSELHAVGFVSPDETKLARVQPRFSGWIEQLPAAETGQRVTRGQVLANIYNLELLPAQQEYLAARRWASASDAPGAARAPAALNHSLEQDARGRLELLGMTAAEIDQITKTGNAVRTVAITAPSSGYIISKNAVLGAYVQPGTQLFDIADLSRVWVLADIYEHEIGRVKVGQRAEIALTAYPNERFSGSLGFIYPALDERTRTLRVRIELDNPGLQLRPGMYGDVSIRLESARGVVIPVEALVDTGNHQYVFVAKQGGVFEPRRVRVGTRSRERVQVLEGLAAGELVVTTSNFLIDSESRLRAAIEAPPNASPSPSPASSGPQAAP